MNLIKPDYTRAIEVADQIYWLGFPDFEAGFSNNPYLIYSGDESILLDPGPGYPLFRDILLQKIEQVCSPNQIRYIIVHHQDPDLCGMIPLIESFLHPEIVILAHTKTALFLPYYGIKKPIVTIDEDDTLELPHRTIQFICTPYVHFAGSIMSYDQNSKILFSSDVFAVLEKEWDLYANKDYLQKAKIFLESYIESKDSLLNVYQKLKKLEIKKILPQHGGIIQEELVNEFIELLPTLEPGILIQQTQQNQSKNKITEENLLKQIIQFASQNLQIDKPISTLEELLKIAKTKSISSLVQIVSYIAELEKKFGIKLKKHKRKLNSKTIKEYSYNTSKLFHSIYKKVSVKQNSIYKKQYFDKIIESSMYSKNSFKQNLVIMFFDIRKFTAYSQDKEVTKVFSILNKEISLVSQIIKEMGGRINKIMGDGVLAYFFENHISSALRAGIKIQKMITQYKLLGAGISFDFGEVILGDIGVEEKVDFTMIGKVVNRASRLNTITDRGEIALTENMFHLLDPKYKQLIEKNPFLTKATYYSQKLDEKSFPYIKFTVVHYKNKH